MASRSKAQMPWLIASIVIVLAMMLPLIGILTGILTPVNDTWRHIQHYLLADYIRQTAILLVGSLSAGIIIASLLAWFVTAYEFPGRKFLSFALVLPLAIPPYIAGYTYVSMTGYTGPLQVFLRDHLGITLPPGFLDLQNMGGAIAIFTLFLYPYIYLVVRAFLDRQAGQLLEAARVLGASKTTAYLQVIAPLTRNAVVAGATLMAFEVLSDYGVVSYFGLQVFTTAIFKAWLGLTDMAAALKLAAILLVVVTLVSVGEKALRGGASYAYASPRVTPLRRSRPHGVGKILIPGFCWLIFAVSLIIPVAQMLWWAVLSLDNIRLTGIWTAVANSVIVAGCGALVATICAMIVAQHQRLWPSRLARLLARITVMGYSVPSTVIALSIVSLLVWISTTFGAPLTLTPAVIVLAYVIRYLAVSMQSIESGCERIGIRYHEAARTSGDTPAQALWRVDLPMMRSATIGAFLLAFIDMVKELPIVLIVRPFNFATLSTTVFQYANDEQIPESALPSLMIIALACIPVALLVARETTTGDQQPPTANTGSPLSSTSADAVPSGSSNALPPFAQHHGSPPTHSS
ncbi:ABC transporter permease [Corynebacterium choanae]|uniref:Sulfate transport system permease protein CysW n=1 Tax=Corynebacterium choanae TaxID=1862358 RepID=A0A3G6J3G1_9CORY|nr:iron ABC transporter permease [Corynebacterium choanae]AZA12472.1 Sulfate transport system permease protein CysW [Corynebacterium choanae]